MSGPRRLALFVSAVWIVGVFFLSVANEFPRPWSFSLVFGVTPVALVWGVVWVVAGFRSR